MTCRGRFGLLQVSIAGTCLVLCLAAPAHGGKPAPQRWADRSFATSGELSQWLGSRGADYGRWAALHPAAAAALEGRVPPEPPVILTDAHDRPRPPAAANPAQAAGSRLDSLLPAIPALVALLLALAVVPLPGRGPLVLLRGRRLELVAAAVAVAVGLLIARGLG